MSQKKNFSYDTCKLHYQSIIQPNPYIIRKENCFLLKREYIGQGVYEKYQGYIGSQLRKRQNRKSEV